MFTDSFLLCSIRDASSEAPAILFVGRQLYEFICPSRNYTGTTAIEFVGWHLARSQPITLWARKNAAISVFVHQIA